MNNDHLEWAIGHLMSPRFQTREYPWVHPETGFIRIPSWGEWVDPAVVGDMPTIMKDIFPEPTPRFALFYFLIERNHVWQESSLDRRTMAKLLERADSLGSRYPYRDSQNRPVVRPMALSAPAYYVLKHPQGREIIRGIYELLQ